MPTYDYRCKDCGKEFEHFQSMKDDALTNCLCEKNGSVERLISKGSGIIFKGSGFYVNDYKKSSAPSSESSAGTSSTPASSTTSSTAPTSTPSNSTSSN
ncbi:MAG: zinc ribbon domain-containing protein [Leptospira sp.]|nr:zinc ribbon domain-containing protein [Leptospira sp.]